MRSLPVIFILLTFVVSSTNASFPGAPSQPLNWRAIIENAFGRRNVRQSSTSTITNAGHQFTQILTPVSTRTGVKTLRQWFIVGTNKRVGADWVPNNSAGYAPRGDVVADLAKVPPTRNFAPPRTPPVGRISDWIAILERVFGVGCIRGSQYKDIIHKNKRLTEVITNVEIRRGEVRKLRQWFLRNSEIRVASDWVTSERPGYPPIGDVVDQLRFPRPGPRYQKEKQARQLIKLLEDAGQEFDQFEKRRPFSEIGEFDEDSQDVKSQEKKQFIATILKIIGQIVAFPVIEQIFALITGNKNQQVYEGPEQSPSRQIMKILEEAEKEFGPTTDGKRPFSDANEFDEDSQILPTGDKKQFVKGLLKFLAHILAYPLMEQVFALIRGKSHNDENENQSSQEEQARQLMKILADAEKDFGEASERKRPFSDANEFDEDSQILPTGEKKQFVGALKGLFKFLAHILAYPLLEQIFALIRGKSHKDENEDQGSQEEQARQLMKILADAEKNFGEASEGKRSFSELKDFDDMGMMKTTDMKGMKQFPWWHILVVLPELIHPFLDLVDNVLHGPKKPQHQNFYANFKKGEKILADAEKDFGEASEGKRLFSELNDFDDMEMIKTTDMEDKKQFWWFLLTVLPDFLQPVLNLIDNALNGPQPQHQNFYDTFNNGQSRQYYVSNINKLGTIYDYNPSLYDSQLIKKIMGKQYEKVSSLRYSTLHNNPESFE